MKLPFSRELPDLITKLGGDYGFFAYAKARYCLEECTVRLQCLEVSLNYAKRPTKSGADE